MKEKLAIVIAVLMITSMAFAISTTNVSATHTTTVSIDDDTVKANTTMVRTITVQNAGPDVIDNVWIVVPSGFTAFAPVMKIPKDNEVTLEDNVVTLKAGTLIELDVGATLKAPGGTPVIIPKGTTIRWVPVTAVTGVLNENLSAKIENFVKDIGTGSVTAVGDFENSIAAAENENVAADIQITLNSAYGTARLLTETRVVRGTDNMVRLPENTLVALVSATTASLGADTEIRMQEERVATLNADNTINPEADNIGRIFVALAGATTNTIYTVSANDNVLVVDSAITENIIYPAGTVLKLAVAATVDVWDNTKVVRAVDENVKMTPATATATENDPINWSQSVAASSTAPPGTYVEWENNVGIASGASLAFPFAVTTPSAGGDYTIYVKTTDTTGLSAQKEITLTIDNASPTVTIVASPSWIGENLDVTITLTASEKLAKLENVMVAENNAPENTQITMTPDAENRVWTGTYTTGDNTQRDGTATIYVIGSQFEDLVGNAGVDNTGTFGVDRLKPPTPNVTQITGFPTDAATTLAPGIQTKQANWFIENIAQDNFAGSLVVQKDMTVKIRVGTTVSDIITPASGYYSKTITLSEGIQEIGIQYIDKAGNVGMEDNENVTLDATKPSISITSPADGAIITDNTPLISLTIADATLGVENATPYAFADNSGYTVQLRRDNDNAVLATLMPKTFPTSDPFKSFTLENQWPLDNELPSEMWFNIFVQAGDNLQKDNTHSRFKIDVTAPGTPSLTAISVDIDNPLVIKTASRTVTGTAEAGAKIKVYFNGAEQTALETTADATTGAWSVIVAPTPGTTTKIEFRAVDKAGNEGSKVLYGYLLVDGSEPTVAITAPESGLSTDAMSIILEATVTKDTWEEYSELTVRIDATSLTAPLTATNVLSDVGKLTRAVELVEGTNTISVSAQDVAGNWSTVKTVTITRTVTPWATYAIIIVIVALILAAIAIFRKR
ncbi:MAG: hypothetical protein KAV43_03450 [Hadesarchaea archaeon]|nr:hypothetical protein [Hadesarchaea archaeon]